MRTQHMHVSKKNVVFSNYNRHLQSLFNPPFVSSGAFGHLVQVSFSSTSAHSEYDRIHSYHTFPVVVVTVSHNSSPFHC